MLKWSLSGEWLHHVALVAIVSASQQTVVLQIGQKIAKRLTCMTFLYMITLRNKTVAHTFLPPFDNANGRLCQKRLL